MNLDELLAQKEKLRARMKEYQDAEKVAKGQEKAMLQNKIRVYRASLKDLQVQIDYLDPPKERKARRTAGRQMHVGAMAYDFFERNNVCWSDLEGHTWNQVEAGDPVELSASMEELQHWMAEGSERLTKRQRLYLDAYYNDGLSTVLIAERYGVTKSTVSRVIRNGLARMQSWVDSKALIESCMAENGRFDWVKYLSQVPALTDRQRQLMLLVLSKYPKNNLDLSEKLELDPSTIQRTLSRASSTIHRLGASGTPTRRLELHDWDSSDKFSLAIETGMRLYFYYRFCFKGQHIGGVTRYIYELSCRREAGETPEAVAEEFGLKVRTVRAAYSRLKHDGISVGHMPRPKDGTIGANIDPETYIKLQRMVTARVNP